MTDSAKEWDGRPARLFCFISCGRDVPCPFQGRDPGGEKAKGRS
jgi:hypothetical protein